MEVAESCGSVGACGPTPFVEEAFLASRFMTTLIAINDLVPTLDCNPGSLATQLPSQEWLSQALSALELHGCLRLDGAFSPLQMERLKAEHDKRYRRYFDQSEYLDARDQGHLRTLVTLEIEGGFNSPEFYANEWVYPIVTGALGNDCILGHLATILSRPGSDDQFVHRDTPSLFGDSSIDARMPAPGLAMVLPFMKLGESNGGTHVWPGTHRVAKDDEAHAFPSAVAHLTLGSCLLFSVRLLHGGKGNRSHDLRNIVYAAYHRRWFRDWDGFERQAPISITRRNLRHVRPQHLHLFSWRFDDYDDWRKMDAVKRATHLLPKGLLPTLRRAAKKYR